MQRLRQLPKDERQRLIASVVGRRRVGSQHELQGALRKAGCEVTQATISRDIRELGLAKVGTPDGGSHYSAPLEGPPSIRPHLEQLLPAMLVAVDGVGPLLVLKTPAGAAQALGVALDGAGWSEVIGTISGDDAVLVITRSERARRAVQTRLEELAGLSR